MHEFAVGGSWLLHGGPHQTLQCSREMKVSLENLTRIDHASLLNLHPFALKLSSSTLVEMFCSLGRTGEFQVLSWVQSVLLPSL